MFNSGLSSDERNLILSMAKAITIIADAVSENIDNIDFDEIIEDVNYYSLLVSGNTDNETPHEIKSMNKEDFKEYIDKNFNIDICAKRLISNILDFVEKNYPEENEQYNVLCELLDCTIGLSDEEIRKVYL